MSGARSALERSYRADFSELTVDQILDLVAEALGWPDQMPQTLDLAALGLDARTSCPEIRPTPRTANAVSTIAPICKLTGTRSRWT